jgi:hypothetical protein
MTKHDAKNPKDQAIFVRVSQAEIDRLDALAERYAFLTRSGLAREAMRVGLDRIEAEGLDALARTDKPKAAKRKAKT